MYVGIHIQWAYDALQVFTLVILEARLVTRDALRELLSYKVVINCSRAVFATTSMEEKKTRRQNSELYHVST